MPKSKLEFAKAGSNATKKAREALNELDPIAVNKPGDGVDREKAFQTYCSFNGDIERTAHAVGINPVALLALADEEKWSTRLRHVFELRKAGKPGDVERAISRTMNFVQAHRLRVFLDKLVTKLYNMTDDELEEACFAEAFDKEGHALGRKLNLKPFTELAAALEKCHMMTYYSLNDSMPERAKRKDNDDGEVSLTEIHSTIAKQMAEVGASKTPRAMLFDAQLAQAKAANPGRELPDFNDPTK